MKKIKLIDSKKALNKRLKNDDFKSEYEGFQEEFELAKQVINLRIKAKLTQKELAEKAGTSQPAIARLESGNYKNLSLSFLRRIGDVFGVQPYIQFK
ncbi:MAG TPA: XRE family transcriptional regulator [Ignavibacteria bacterium]|nr:XRE family transcriptional regulator [Ignavibacteria bacterium]